MAIPFWTPRVDTPQEKSRDAIAVPAEAAEAEGLSLCENADFATQREMLDALPVLIFLEKAGSIVFANAEARRLLGLAAGEWTAQPAEDLLWGLRPGAAEPHTQLTADGKGSPFHAAIPVAGGGMLAVEGTCSVLSAERREAIVVAHPSTQERAPRPRLMEDVLASIPEAIVIVHNDHVLYTNPSFTEMFGYTAEEAGGENLRELIIPETRRHETSMVEREVDRRGRVKMETVRMHKSGELVDVALEAGPLRVEQGSVGYVFSFRNIVQRVQVEERLRKDALYDVLTGLPNRTLFLDRVSIALNRRSRRSDQSCAVLMLDLDRFKEIGGALGHAAGEALLTAVGERLRSALRPHDSASRVGPDEYAVLIENILDPSDIEIVAARILNEVERPFEIYGHFVRASASLGAAIAGSEPIGAEMLLRNADFAMYRARQEGGGGFEIFDKNLERFAKSRREPEMELRRAMEKRQFEVWYQPIYRLESGSLDGFESLLRLRRPDGSVESFSGMIDVAEEVGLSITLGREALHTVCRQLAIWTDAVPDHALTVTVNLTHRQFYHPELASMVSRTLATCQVDPSRLLFEVSETTLNENLEQAARILERLSALQVRLAVDQFGSGLAPLNYLVRLPIDMVKLAPELTRAAAGKGRSQAVLESLIRLGHAVGVQVVAQGIEQKQQLDALRRMGCEFGQGHLLSHALDAAQAGNLAGLSGTAMAARA